MASDLPHGLPDGLELTRTTPEFTSTTVPAGLRSAHQVADDVWGALRVRTGSVTFVLEESGERILVAAGESQLIEPGVRHHVEPADDAGFVIEFYR